MSQPAGGAKMAAARPRRASRAPVKANDENGPAQAAQPRLIGKSSVGTLAAAGRLAGKAAGVTVPVGKPVVGGAGAAGPRRAAFGEVTNNVARNAGVTGKEAAAGPSKPVVAARTRQGSANAAAAVQIPSIHQPPSSTGTGFSKLKIGGGARRVPSKASLSDPKAAMAKGSEFAGSVKEEVELIQATEAPIGLGIVDVEVSPTAHKRPHPIDDSDDEGAESDGDAVGSKVRILDTESADPEDWLVAVFEGDEAEDSALIKAEIKKEFDEQLDFWDTTMVAEYAEEIFEYMGQLEEAAMPHPRYMDHQTEIEWSMRTTLVDWLLQVHVRYHMLPETLWIAVNIVDRFLSNRVVSLVKFQLVGVTAMFIAAKYEEIMAPSVDEFVFMTEGGYTRDEILKGERIILQSLDFNISPYCSPYSWVRRISKADDYDIQTRTLSKFLMEVTLLDHRFLRAKPSMVAAIGMYLARRMLGGDWNEAFIYYSDFTEQELAIPSDFLLELIGADGFDQKFVYKKYSSKKFLKASIFARNWARSNPPVLEAVEAEDLSPKAEPSP